MLFMNRKRVIFVLLFLFSPIAVSDALKKYGCDARDAQQGLSTSELIKTFVDDPKESLDYIDNLRGFGGCDFQVFGEIISFDNGEEKSRFTVDIKVNEIGSSLVEIIEPKRESGRKILKIQSDVWLYLPKNRNTIRIAPLQRIFGSASISDVLSGSYNLHYNATTPHLTDCDGKPCYEIESTIKDQFSGMYRVVFFLDSDSLRLIKSHHRSKSGRLLQSVIYYEMSVFHDQEKIIKLKVTNQVKKGEVSWIRFSNYEPNKYSEKIFNKSNIGKI